MSQTMLGYDFSNLSSCTVKRRNNLLSMIFVIIGVSLLPIFIIFLMIFIFQASIDINGASTPYGDPAYMRFFSVFLPVMGLVSFGLIALALLNVFGKPKTYLIMDSNNLDLSKFYYIYDHKKKEEIYLTDKHAIIYRKRYQAVSEENNPQEIKKLMRQYVFWTLFAESERSLDIKQKNNKTIIKTNLNLEDGSRSYYYRKFVLYPGEMSLPSKVSETIGYARSGTQNIQSYAMYYFENINRNQMLLIHPDIKKVLESLY